MFVCAVLHEYINLLKTDVYNLSVNTHVQIKKYRSSITVLFALKIDMYLIVCLMVFNATFNNISVISWRSVLLVEETNGPGKNH
jgi:hypothetical protein